jgi:transposase-like protein
VQDVLGHYITANRRRSAPTTKRSSRRRSARSLCAGWVFAISGRSHTAWDNIIPFFQFLPEIRKVIYTTNAIESLNMVMRRFTRNRRFFPNDEAALKGLFLAIREASKN